MSLTPGTKLGSFEISGLLGRGGMGEVYRARDTKLGREVAIKVLPKDFARDPERLARFEREARFLASLNHSGIGALYEFREDDGVRFLVLELVEGETLADRIEKGPIPIKEALALFIQIAEALKCAHEQKVIHRDLKPANIKITPAGTVKVLDFGLAKSNEPIGPALSTDPTRMSDPNKVTTDGAILGTPSYMSPEQARGQDIDHGADIWAFGCCLYEALTGQVPFKGATVSDLMVEILDREPNWRILPEALPAQVDSLVRRCLEKDSRRRLSSAGDIAITLEEAAEGLKRDSQRLDGPAVSSERRGSGGFPLWAKVASAAVVLVLVLGGAYFVGRSGVEPRDGSRAGAEAGTSTAQRRRVASLAVLPFVNLAGGQEQEYFVESMADELIGNLTTISSLKIIARTSSSTYKDTEKRARQIAEELGVDALVEGSVSLAGGEVRVTAKLVDGETEESFWAENYTGTMKDLLQIQSDIVLAVLGAIQVTVTDEELRRIASVEPVNPEAYRALVVGHHFLNDISEDGLNTAIRYFEEATRIDPNYAEAWGGMVCAYVEFPLYGLESPAVAFPKALAAGVRALELKEDLGRDHSHLGFVSMAYDHDWEHAERRFQRGMELSPGDNVVYLEYSQFLLVVGRGEEALKHVEMTLELDPLIPIFMQRIWAERTYLETDPERVRRNMEQFRAREPDYLPAMELLTIAYRYLGMDDAALTTAEDWAQQAERNAASLTNLALTLADMGQADRAREILEKVAAIDDYYDSSSVGYVYVVLGELDSAFEWLEKGYGARDFSAVWLRTMPFWKIYLDDPDWIAFRNDPRYADLIARMNFPPLPKGHPGHPDSLNKAHAPI